MNRIIVLIFCILITYTVQGQLNLQVGDSCFESGNYNCALINYQNVFKNSYGIDRREIDVKLTRVKSCLEHIKIANEAFSNQNYTKAKVEYLEVLNSNPKDSYVQSQIVKCNSIINTPKLRKATTADITDIWNNKYGIQPIRRQNLINAGIDADDAQKRISAGEGKPQVLEKQETNLSVSKYTINFNSNGGTSEEIKVLNGKNTLSVPSYSIPKWCTVNINNSEGYFIVTASPNTNNSTRSDWFIITDGTKQLKIFVDQSANTETLIPNSGFSNNNGLTKNYDVPKNYSSKEFNSPKTHDSWGLTIAYAPKSIINSYCDFVQLGLKFEPLFKYGFGFNTGIIFESSYKNTFDYYTLNLPLHAEYRLNFSKWFNVFTYGGWSFNYIGKSNSSVYNLTATSDYGVGVRINHLQFNVGKNRFMRNLNTHQNFGSYTKGNEKVVLAMSYMF